MREGGRIPERPPERLGGRYGLMGSEDRIFSELEAGLRGGLVRGMRTVGLWTRNMGAAGREWVGLRGVGLDEEGVEGVVVCKLARAFCSFAISESVAAERERGRGSTEEGGMEATEGGRKEWGG